MPIAVIVGDSGSLLLVVGLRSMCDVNCSSAINYFPLFVDSIQKASRPHSVSEITLIPGMAVAGHFCQLPGPVCTSTPFKGNPDHISTSLPQPVRFYRVIRIPRIPLHFMHECPHAFIAVHGYGSSE